MSKLSGHEWAGQGADAASVYVDIGALKKQTFTEQVGRPGRRMWRPASVYGYTSTL